MLEYIKSDLFRYCGRVSVWLFIKLFILSSTYRHQTYIRLSNCEGRIKYFWRLFYYVSRYFHKNLQISYKCKIGYGLYIGHDGPIVVSPYTIIGDNCNLSQFTTIGTNTTEGATIGSNVYIGPNVCIVGKVTIGGYATIGAGSVVTKDIPDRATAAGNYAKILNYNEPGRYIHNEWKIK
mgnify:FL=1